MTPEVVPPRVPQYRWVDFGLPSGTLWLDRLVGAQSPQGKGMFYQWGAIVGHTESDGYDFSEETYEAQGLNLITSDLNDSQDAARAYYGPAAKMPTSEQMSELINYTSIRRDGNSFIFTSNVNGELLKFPAIGFMSGVSMQNPGRLCCWLRELENNSLRVYANMTHIIGNYTRYDGFNIMAVHS